MSILRDIDVLHKTGTWPNGEVPDWAFQAAARLHCRPTSPHVIEHGLMEVLIRQQKTIADIIIALEGLVESATSKGVSTAKLLETVQKVQAIVGEDL